MPPQDDDDTAYRRQPWRMTVHLIDVFHNQDMTYEERRDAIIGRLRTKWVEADGGPLDRTIEDLADAIDVEEFDDVWAEILERADVDRVWLATR